MFRNLVLALVAGCLLTTANFVLLTKDGSGTEAEHASVEVHPEGYVGQARCAGCHTAETAAWRNSHHAMAMGVAVSTDLKDRFTDAAAPVGRGAFASFFDRGRPMVRLEGAAGKPADYPIAYSFGHYPLQQYLVPFPGGRYQAIPFAWDSRSAQDGGQRWFNLDPDSAVAPGDALHWTSYNHTWNSMCADCHSTGLKKGYDHVSGTYRTTWSDISVACEACHGPGATHVAWAEQGGPRDTPNSGFDVPLKEAGADGHWGDFDSRGIRRWKGGERQGQLDRCAPCHSRRRTLQDSAPAGTSLLDGYSPALLDDELYYPDGQIKDEVFELGSFLQSRMSRAQVICTDCHEPHTAKLRAPANDLCGQCHDARRFDAATHHHHAPGSAAAKCTTCHMPSKTYMGVHVRHDHSFRLPAPARAASLGSPDPCIGCHGDRGAAWAEEALDRWAGGRHRIGSGFATALAAGRNRSAGAMKVLLEAIADDSNPPIARASALALLSRFPGAAAWEALRQASADPDPLIRMGAVRGAAPYAGGELHQLLSGLVRDPRRAVRTEAARLLAPFPDTASTAEQRLAVKDGLDEWVAAELLAAERPESWFNLGTLWADLGKADDAEAAFKGALALDPRFTSASLNLADLYRSQRRDAESVNVLRHAVSLAEEDADAHYALGLALVRRGQRDEALVELEKAATLKPGEVRFAYAFGLGLAESGDGTRALLVLDAAHRRFPDERDLLVALISLAKQTGNATHALEYARALEAQDSARNRH